MKKIVVMAAMILGVSSAFAADSDALKAIMKAKTYAEAESLLNSSLSQLASDAEKAKAYNKLYELSIKGFEEISVLIGENQKAMVMKEEQKPYDTAAYYNNAYNAVKAAVECDKYDGKPDAKGKIKILYRENQERLQKLSQARIELVNAGQWADGHGDESGLLKYWSMFLDSRSAELFSSLPKEPFLGQVAFYAGAYAQRANEFKMADRYFDIALEDSAYHDKAENAKFEVAGRNLHSKADTLSYIKKLEDLYTAKNSAVAFSVLCKLYNAANMTAELNNLVDRQLAKNPKDFLALAYRAQDIADKVSRETEKPNWDPAIEAYKALLEASDGSQAFVFAGLGQCLCKKAGLIEVRAEQRALFQEALPLLEKARDLDPDNNTAWAYFLYVCYGSVFSYNDSRAIEIKEKFGF